MKKLLVTGLVICSLLFPTVASAAPKSGDGGPSVLSQVIHKIRHLVGLDDIDYTPPKP